MTQRVLPQPLADGRYPLRSILGEGGMATVYRGFDEMLQVERAIKVLSPAMARNEKIRTRFLGEARTMARLRHPNIVGVFDVGMDGVSPYIVMEMIEGGSLMDLVQAHGPFQPQVAAWVTIGMLRGLHQAHEIGVIHRDIKPHNVLLTPQGVAKLTDFGIAHAESINRSMTRTGAVMGTMAYMAPEQRRSAKDTGVQSDIFSSGATLYVLLKGEEPFDLYATEFHEELFEGVDGPLAKVIQRACSYLPKDRHSSATEMVDNLLSIIDDLPGSELIGEHGQIRVSDAFGALSNESDEASYSVEGDHTDTLAFNIEDQESTSGPPEDLAALVLDASPSQTISLSDFELGTLQEDSASPNQASWSA